jgi:hypothetical protein
VNVYAVKGAKVVCTHPERGFAIHQEAALKHLDLGHTYTVQRTVSSMLYTRVWLQEVPLVEFNAIQFDDAESS